VNERALTSIAVSGMGAGAMPGMAVGVGNNNDLGNPKPLVTAIALAAYLFPGQFPKGI
jgi:hypothetical protein